MGGSCFLLFSILVEEGEEDEQFQTMTDPSYPADAAIGVESDKDARTETEPCGGEWGGGEREVSNHAKINHYYVSFRSSNAPARHIGPCSRTLPSSTDRPCHPSPQS